MTVNQWQPIETAPMDGSEVLVFSRDGFDIAYYDALAALWREASMGMALYSNYEHVVPTHWMPLPPEPETSEGTEAPL